jgi:ubiquinone/menaquinone biosynthesis C-methylase UbiE
MKITDFVNAQLKNPIVAKVIGGGAYGVLVARAMVHFAQGLPLFAQKRIIREIAGLKTSEVSEIRKLSFERLMNLFKQDSQNIVEGHYPIEVLLPELGPMAFTKSWIRVMWDGLGISLREAQNKKNYFDQDAEKLLADLPEYYRRNFHFQTNGYLSRDSAAIYDHQVDLLFLGTSAAMRRQLIPMLKTRLDPAKDHIGLEIGVGTGSAARPLLMSMPNIKLDVLDLSQPYLDHAKERLAQFSNVTYLQGQGEDLPQQNESLDFVYSVYVFHEIPMEIRKQIVSEVYRVLKPGGLFVLADSIQKGDDKDYDWVLDLFPQNFHEPFYMNYIKNSTDELFSEGGKWSILEHKIGFTTKLTCVQKN